MVLVVSMIDYFLGSHLGEQQSLNGLAFVMNFEMMETGER
jgi:hypothetical protein